MMRVLNNLQYTLTLLKKNLGFTALCTSVIAIGLAIVLPLYSLVDNLALKTLPIDQGERYVALLQTQKGSRFSLYDTFHYNFFKDNASSFESLEAFRDTIVTISDGEYTETYSSAEISPVLLQFAAGSALRGRTLTPADSLPGAEPVALLGYNVWQNYYAGQENIIGQQSNINGEITTIIGVMAEGFSFPYAYELWLPLPAAASGASASNPGDGAEDLIIAGILASNRSIKDAANEIALLQNQIKTNWPDDYASANDSTVEPFVNVLGGVSGLSFLLIPLVSIILLIAFNLGNLFITRGDERMHELAIRSALGATPKDISQTLLQESFIVSILGLLIGLGLAHFGIEYVNGLLSNASRQMTSSFWWDMSLNYKMVLAGALSVLAIWCLSGGLPALRISRSNINDFLSSGGKGVSLQSSTKLGKILVNLQLVFGCLLLSIGLVAIISNANEITTTVNNSDSLFSGRILFNNDNGNDNLLQQNYRIELEQALLNQTGVDRVGFSTSVPGNGGATSAYTIEDQDLLIDDSYPRQYVNSISNDYFTLFDVEILEGRGFSTEDSLNSLPVAIVDQRLVDTWWPNESVIGKRVQVNPDDNTEWLTVVGVSSVSILNTSLTQGEPGTPVLYRPIQQTNPAQHIVIMSSLLVNIDYRQTLRNAASQVDRDVALNSIQSFTEREAAVAFSDSFNRNISLALMLIALYLTGASTYGLAARAANRRRIETGIRMALGASQLNSLWVFLKDGLKTLLVGLSLGAVLAISIAYLLLSSSTSNTNFALLIPTVALICFIMGGLVMLANYIPAKKIIKMEPGDALRYE